ncbi:MAG: polyprenyl synthetase family protein [Clostridia bacterium]|nr:polyprenyl synthetase family protein [Clostridia bacterium]
MMKQNDLKQAMTLAAEQTEARLLDLLEEKDSDLSLLFESMRYSAMAGGKRIRPYLTIAFCDLFGGRLENALYFAAAIEMVHTYSLIHDDLPCMDDDDLRRGKPTNHKVYGEAEAVLAGDALLTMAFEALTRASVSPTDAVRAVRCLSEAAGARGMVGGQMMDIRAEKISPDRETLMRLHKRKTGALITAAAELGCIAAGVTDEETLDACRQYAGGIGLAFQIIDDILDRYGDTATLGKQTGQDEKDGKTTFLTFADKNEAYSEAELLTDEAKAAIEVFDGSENLLLFADMLLHRTH